MYCNIHIHCLQGQLKYELTRTGRRCVRGGARSCIVCQHIALNCKKCLGHVLYAALVLKGDPPGDSDVSTQEILDVLTAFVDAQVLFCEHSGVHNM